MVMRGESFVVVQATELSAHDRFATDGAALAHAFGNIAKPATPS